MGLMISSIAKINNGIMPKYLFCSDSDYYLYVLEYSDFDFQETHNYSSDWHSSEMTRILNNYSYNFRNRNMKKLKSQTFHSDKIMSWSRIFDIENLNYDEIRPASVTPAFLFTTVSPSCLTEIKLNNISNDIFVFLKILPKDRDANRIPQFVNEIISNIGLAVSRSKRSNIESVYENVHFFDYRQFDDQKLTNELQQKGVTAEQIAELISILKEEKQDAENNSFGTKASKWIEKVCKTITTIELNVLSNIIFNAIY